VVFEDGETTNVSVLVEHADCQVCGFNELEDFRLRVHSIKDVIFANFDQADDLVAVVWVRSAQYNAIVVEFLFLKDF
jgi:hypothetical protein